ncbi:hypothetical protein HYE32_00890 [Mycoplasmopsis bovis]|nr:hypothetical protein [Mycoplasmopsis bovis]QQH22207.1 hypothetical protein HYE32_00890 [Mycoplasmopsis bovis]
MEPRWIIACWHNSKKFPLKTNVQNYKKKQLLRNILSDGWKINLETPEYIQKKKQ